ncbi:MAG: DUF975 family protein [Ruminiclostridium sp.]|nr:DUF975 family protein [Ruminiclostridium sp.]
MMNPLCLRATLMLVCMSVGLFGIRSVTGSNLTMGLVSLADYADTATGIYPNAEGFSIILRMDLTGMVMAIPVAYDQLIRFGIMMVLAYLVLSPLRLGAMEQYWSTLRGDQKQLLTVTQWFRKKNLFGKALVVEGVIQGVVRFIGMACAAPAFYLYYLFYSSVESVDDLTTQMVMLQNGASFLAIFAGLLWLWLHSAMLPIRYCLAAHPEYTLKQVFSRGWASMQGYRMKFFWFRTTLLPWFFFSQLTYNVLDLYVTPYTSLASMVYVQECAKDRAAKANDQEERAESEEAE